MWTMQAVACPSSLLPKLNPVHSDNIGAITSFALSVTSIRTGNLNAEPPQIAHSFFCGSIPLRTFFTTAWSNKVFPNIAPPRILHRLPSLLGMTSPHLLLTVEYCSSSEASTQHAPNEDIAFSMLASASNDPFSSLGGQTVPFYPPAQ